MRISEKLSGGEGTVSLEVFPPKNDAAFESIEKAVREIASLSPDFISVTYGAGGGTSRYTERIASMIKNELKTEALAHITCASTTREQISRMLNRLAQSGIENILALRGDLTEDCTSRGDAYYSFAYELISHIRRNYSFDIGAACYPEGHTECESLERDIDNLKIKVDCGVDFLITQLFYDNSLFYRFMDRLAAKSIGTPVIAGIMPITNIKQIDRIRALSGTKIPPRVSDFLQRYRDNPEDLQKAGLCFAIEQINDLMQNGTAGVHIYTMNKPFTAETVLNGIK